MDVRLSAEQEALRHSVALVVDRLGPKTVAQIDDAERRRKLDAAVSDSGWRELRAATDDGSPLASGVEATLVAEELGRGVADVAFVGPTLAAELRRLIGLAPSEALETVALDGRLEALIGMGHESSPALAIDARGSLSCLALVPDSDRYRVGQMALADAAPGPDLTRPAARVEPTSTLAVVDGTDRLLSHSQLDQWTALGLALTCGDLVGIMRGAIRLACDYATERRQYGAAIGSFQAVQHLLADALVLMEGSASITLHAAWAVDALPAPDALAAAVMAKAYCARSARTVCETVIQVHGGIGNTWDCMAHVFLRRALVSSQLLGDDGVNVSRLLALEEMGGGHGLR